MRDLNFVVSYEKSLWISSNKNLFIADPHIYHLLERDNEQQYYDKIIAAPFRRLSKEALIEDSKIVDEKYLKYVKIIASRLNAIHGKDYDVEFWRKALSMAFIRCITIYYNQFQIFETYFDPRVHECRVMSEESYYTPTNFEDQRHFLQYTNFGQEQIFSQYIHLFHPGQFLTTFLDLSNFSRSNINSIGSRGKLYKYLSTTFQKIKNKRVNKKVVQIGIQGSFFSEKNIKKLNDKSEDRISLLGINTSDYPITSFLQTHDRKELSKSLPTFDKFDTFFFSTLEYWFPTMFLENFEELEDTLEKQLGEFSNLRYLICENWISHSGNSLLLAIAKKQNIQHICNEHNCFFHPYAGSYIKHVISMSDIFATLGWTPKKEGKVIKSASLREFDYQESTGVKYKALFMASPSMAKMTHFSSAYGYSEENGPKKMEFNRTFFSNLSSTTLSLMSYRMYPKQNVSMQYDLEFGYSDLISLMNKTDPNTPARLQMRQSRLLVIDYISTTYLEALVMNVPFVFFWDSNAYYLNDEFAGFFDGLIEVGICQTDPVVAANFVDQIINNPKLWWCDKKTQLGRRKFMDQNMGNPDEAIKFYLSFLDSE